MKKYILLLYLIQLTLSDDKSDICTSVKDPNQPNDCTIFSKIESRCCFDKVGGGKCIREPKNITENIFCEDDYFYLFKQEDYSKTSNQKGYCTYLFNQTKGTFAYSASNSTKFIRNGLTLNCLNSSYIIFNYILITIIVILLII